MSSNGKRMPAAAGAKQGEEGDPVEQLIQSAQDELLLNLSVNSHMSRVAPDYLLPDLDRRFQALKSRPSSTITTVKSPSSSSASTTMLPKPKIHHQDNNTNNNTTNIDPDDLFARFAALKSSNTTATGPVVGSASGFDQSRDDDEGDEVEKIIKWAKDAARLDPSPPSDDEDDDDDDEDDAGHVPVKGGDRK